MIKLLLVGQGSWGQNYIKTIERIPDIVLTIGTRDNWKSIVCHSDGVIIATPPESHIDIAEICLSYGRPVMIEKPLAVSANDVKRLHGYGSTILVNYTHLFSPAFVALNGLIRDEEILSIYSEGVGLGPKRTYSSLLDYGSHDFSMGFYLTKSDNFIISNVIESKVDQLSNFTISGRYNQIKHNFVVGNAGPQKKRYFQVNTSKNIYIFDDLAENKLTKNSIPIKISNDKPLTLAIEAFIESIKSNKIDNRFGLFLSNKVMASLEESKNRV